MCWRLLVAALLFAVSIGVRSDDNHHTLWAVTGKYNTVYLLGSVHALRAADSNLPQEALSAYNSAKALVMEIDLNEANTTALLDSIVNLATLPDDQSLEGAMGQDVYDKFTAQAKPLGLDPAFLSHFQPWYAAMMLNQLRLAKHGFNPDAGVDQQLQRRAQSDHKDIIALETIAEQIEIFAHLSLDEQRQLVLYSISDPESDARGLETILAAWRRGDTGVLEQLLSANLEAFPNLYRKLATDRNRKWLPTITRLLSDQRDYLVVVGALHLVGKDGLVEMLKLQGYEVVQH